MLRLGRIRTRGGGRSLFNRIWKSRFLQVVQKYNTRASSSYYLSLGDDDDPCDLRLTSVDHRGIDRRI